MLHRLIGVRFHAGDDFLLTVSERGHRSARSETLIRDGRPPADRRLRS